MEDGEDTNLGVGISVGVGFGSIEVWVEGGGRDRHKGWESD